MYFLNTTRHLVTPASDATVHQLLQRLNGAMTGTAATHGVRSNCWLMSVDGRTMQAFTGFDAAEDLGRAEHSDLHQQNSASINELLGGLSEPQHHTQYRLLVSREIS